MAEKEKKNKLSSATGDNCNDVNVIKDGMNDNCQSGVRKESEQGKLKRIAEMFLAKTGNKEDRREKDEEVKNKDRKMSNRLNKKILKKNKKKNKVNMF